MAEKFCPNRNAVSLGVLPNGVFPICTCDNTAFLYYREDGDLYFYDCSKEMEWNLYELTGNNNGGVVTKLVYFGITESEITTNTIKSLLTEYNYTSGILAMPIDGSVTAKTGRIYLVIPNDETFILKQDIFTITTQYVKILDVTVDGVAYDVYQDTTASYIDVASVFNLEIT